MNLKNDSAESASKAVEWPAQAYVPGGPWPHPGHDATESATLERGLDLFHAGYYWEAHEVWERLWHAEGRRGPTADVLRGLIKLAAAGVKVRQRQPHGVVTHAARALMLFSEVARAEGRFRLGLDLERLSTIARAVAAAPPIDPGTRADRVVRVFAFELTSPRPAVEAT